MKFRTYQVRKIPSKNNHETGKKHTCKSILQTVYLNEELKGAQEKIDVNKI